MKTTKTNERRIPGRSRHFRSSDKSGKWRPHNRAHGVMSMTKAAKKRAELLAELKDLEKSLHQFDSGGISNREAIRRMLQALIDLQKRQTALETKLLLDALQDGETP